MVERNCRVCGPIEGGETFTFREMMFGSRAHFEYFQCPLCSCLQICSMPAALDQYYSDEYYSLGWKPGRECLEMARSRLRHFIGLYVSPNRLSTDMSILDVGSGSGMWVYVLHALGFANAVGIDPYIDNDVVYENGAPMFKKSIFQVDGRWDVVIFNHSLEHISQQLETLEKARELISPQGFCLIRTPIVSSFAWEHYRENWVQIDAPRHAAIHSLKSIHLLAKRAKMEVERILFDSTDFQFWGSEQYRRGIPLNSDASYSINPLGAIFSSSDIAQFKRMARQLNAGRRGDQAAFLLVSA